MNKHTTIYILSFLTLCATPSIMYAQNFQYLEVMLNGIGGLLNKLIPLLIAIGIAVFIWGLVLFIGRSGDEKAHEEGKNKMIWGVLALFVIVSVVGLVALLKTIFGIGDGNGGLTPPGIL